MRLTALAVLCLTTLSCSEQPPANTDAATVDLPVDAMQPQDELTTLREKLRSWETNLSQLNTVISRLQGDRIDLVNQIDELADDADASIGSDPKIGVLTGELSEIDGQLAKLRTKRDDYELAIFRSASSIRTIERRRATEEAGISKDDLDDLARTMLELDDSLSDPDRTIADVSNVLSESLAKELAELRKAREAKKATLPLTGRAKRESSIRPLTELNTDGDERGPWLSPDGLRIYWWLRPTLETTQSEIWSAERPDFDTKFTNKRRLAIGEGFSLTGDELEMILLPGRDKDLAFHVARRRSIDDPFEPPSLIREFDEYRFDSPNISTDGNFLVMDRRSGNNASGFYFSRRDNRDSTWQAPKPLNLDAGSMAGERFRSPSLSSDSCKLFGCIIGDRLGGGDVRTVMWSRETPIEPFGRPEVISNDLYIGDRVSHRHCAVSGEVFFVQFPKPGDLWVAVLP